MIYYNNFNKLSSVYFGDKQISKVYYGNYKVYPSSDPTPTPSSDPLFTATLASDVASGSTLFNYMYKYTPATSSKSASWSEAAILANKSYSKGDTISIYASDITSSSAFQGDIYGIEFSDIYSTIKLENGINDWGWDVGCYFGKLKNLESADLSLYTKQGYYSLQGMFMDCTSLTSVTLNQTLVSQATTTKGMFSGCTSLKYFEARDMETDTDYTWENVLNSRSMFLNCTSLEIVVLNNFGSTDTSKTDWENMFSGCTSLNILDMRGTCLTVSDNGKTYYYLKGSSIANLYDKADRNMLLLDTSAPLSNMFYLGMNNATLDNLTDLTLMFYGMTSLKNLAIPNATFNNVTAATQCFYGADKMHILINKAEFKNLTQAKAKYMFSNVNVEKIQINATGQAKLIELNQTSTGIGLPSEWNDTSYSGWIIV